MDWLFSFDPAQFSDWTIAQTPTPSPTPRSNDLELLRSQIEFLRASNAQLSDSFSKFLESMKFALTFLSVLGGIAIAIVGFLVGQNVLEARKNIREARENFREETRITTQRIQQQFEYQLADQVRDVVVREVNNVRRVLDRERIIGSAIVDYYLPSNGTESIEEKLLQERGFDQVRFWNKDTLRTLPNSQFADVVVLDLINSQVFSPQATQQEKEAIVGDYIKQVKPLLASYSALVFYVKGRVDAIDNSGLKYYVPANGTVALIGAVSDSAYVAYGQKQLRK
ncbi:hypothetical protein ACQ4M3_19975 [Leptolyngbya sp. AN03gr2]|uniref:hypothetical protein n=1 Tax=unclassified Leptolyngbya TaxID=2650499 RepID=UPI003D31FBAC